MKQVTAAILASLALSTPATAQFSVPAPTPAQCLQADSAVASRDFSQGSLWVWGAIAQCGAAGGQAIATALRGLATDANTTHRDYLNGSATRIRDSTVLSAALEVAADPAAIVAARVGAFRVALAQHDRSINANDAALSAASPDGTCLLGSASSTSGYAGTPLPTEYLNRIYTTARDVARSTSTPQTVRNAATCARDAVGYLVVPAVYTSKITLVYVCNNKFKAHNDNLEAVALKYDTGEMSADSASFTAKPESDFVFNTDASVTVRLKYSGQVIRTKTNDGIPCS